MFIIPPKISLKTFMGATFIFSILEILSWNDTIIYCLLGVTVAYLVRRSAFCQSVSLPGCKSYCGQNIFKLWFAWIPWWEGCLYHVDGHWFWLGISAQVLPSLLAPSWGLIAFLCAIEAFKTTHLNIIEVISFKFCYFWKISTCSQINPILFSGGVPKNLPVIEKASPEVKKRTVLFRNVSKFKTNYG